MLFITVSDSVIYQCKDIGILIITNNANSFNGYYAISLQKYRLRLRVNQILITGKLRKTLMAID